MAETTQTTNWTTFGGNLFGGNFTLPYGRPSVPTKKTYYKFKEDFINGVLPNTNGKPNILFKKGDVIDGTIRTEKFIFNTNTKGIMAKPTVVGARVEEVGGLVFVPISSVDLFDAETEAQKQIEEALKQANVKAPTKEVLSQDKEDNFYRSLGFTTSGMIKPKVKGRFFVAVVLVAGYFAYKKYKK